MMAQFVGALDVITTRNTPVIEPGVVPIFRLFVTVLWVLLSLAMLRVQRGVGVRPDVVVTIAWFQVTFLLLYLWISPLQQWLGAAYLPIALLVATIPPLVSQPLAAIVGASDGSAQNIRLYFWLLLPLLLISVQYNLWTVLAFTSGTSLLSIVLAVPSARRGGAALALTVQHAGLRWFLFTLTGLIIVRIASAQREQRRELAQKNRQLANYATTLEQLAVSRERNRLARELHDTLAHTLSAIDVQLKALHVQLTSDPAAAQRTLTQTQELTRTGLHESRRALQALRAQPIEEWGLATALQRLAQHTADRGGIQLQLDVPSHMAALSRETEQQVYRIAEEALANVVRHARAQRLQVMLQQTASHLRLCIADDGVGLDPARAQAHGHYGLRGMNERALLIDGTLKIASQPQGGTTIELIVPGVGATA